LLAVTLVTACCLSTAQARELRVYNWEGYIGPDTVKKFEKETGIKVTYDLFDSWETLEAKLLAGNSGYDAVNVGGNFITRQVAAGVYTELDKNKLPNWKNLDPIALKMLGSYDPGLAQDKPHGIPYSYYTIGFGYNVDMLKKVAPGAPLDSWAMLYDPAWAQKTENCGYVLLDSATDVFSSALIYLKLDPFSENRADYQKAQDQVMQVRPYVRTFDANQYWSDLANGEICISLAWSGDIISGKDFAKKGVKLEYSIPKEGTTIESDMFGIPADAPHPEEAYAFLNFLMRPDIGADFSNYAGYPNSMTEGKALTVKEKRVDHGVYPTAEEVDRFYKTKAVSSAINRLRTRIWTKIKTGV
jgi:putrescine transport system substrate-binding protein